MLNKKDQKIFHAHNAAAALAQDKKYRDACDKYRDVFKLCKKDSSEYKWFSLLAMYSLLAQHKEVPWTDEDEAFFTKVAGDKKEPAVIRAQAEFTIGRSLVLASDRDAAEKHFVQVISLYEGMKAADLKQKLMMGGDQRGPTFITVSAYKNDKEGVYNQAIQSLNMINAAWNESGKVKIKKPRRASSRSRSASAAKLVESENENDDVISRTVNAAKKDNMSFYLSAGVVAVAIVAYLYVSTNYY
ncbi:hypothetical protein BC830DRAFT_69705 [Chytriomyces sp. MP71]|nr:hypothetical protein BC830DRAFT_69705 [Chytriomyces sp. MP71]